MHILLPKDFYPTLHARFRTGPLFFLEGPKRGGGGWQNECLGLLDKLASRNSLVAVPMSADEIDEQYHPCILKGSPPDRGGDHFENRPSWSAYHRRHAMDPRATGCLLFWFPEEDKKSPHPEGLYATASREELGWCGGQLMYNPLLHVVGGASRKYPYREYLMMRFEERLAMKTEWSLYITLRQTVEAAIEKSRM